MVLRLSAMRSEGGQSKRISSLSCFLCFRACARAADEPSYSLSDFSCLHVLHRAANSPKSHSRSSEGSGVLAAGNGSPPSSVVCITVAEVAFPWWRPCWATS